jgi:Flp pilus assembly pilin Flp
MKIFSSFKKVKEKIKEFFSDEWGGNLVEYALLIGFALFIFFIIVGMVTGMLDWVQGLVEKFTQLFS